MVTENLRVKLLNVVDSVELCLISLDAELAGQEGQVLMNDCRSKQMVPQDQMSPRIRWPPRHVVL